MEQFALPLFAERRVFTVTGLSQEIRRSFEREFRDVWLTGEISGVKLAASGHYYLTLKDEQAQIRCVWFRSLHRFFTFKPRDGLTVLARGRLDIYEARGDCQFLIEHLEPRGYGALQIAFEQLKEKLAAEGLFDSARKRPLPRFPRRIGIVTSPRGAVISDMLQVLSRRFPGLHVRLYPALVQGEGAAEEVRRGIDYFSRSAWADVVIVARGGGSFEDLWAFNEEPVARAIATSAVPVVSAVGHETDVTIADFVADLRAPTPSAAAEMIVCTRQELEERFDALAHQIAQLLRYRVAVAARRLAGQVAGRALPVTQHSIGRRLQRVDELEYRLRDTARAAVEAGLRRSRALEDRLRDQNPRPRFARDRRRLEMAQLAALHALRLRVSGSRRQAARLETQLEQLSPLSVLERGYAIVVNEAGEVVKSPEAAPVASSIHVRLARGRLEAQVTG